MNPLTKGAAPSAEPSRGSHPIAGLPAGDSGFRYEPVERLALFIESSIYAGTQWVVFEPNDEALWAELRLNIGTFLQNLFEKGDFSGTTPQQAYFVKCDAETNPPSSVATGVVNITVGFAPVFPAEFVIIQIQQMVAQG